MHLVSFSSTAIDERQRRALAALIGEPIAGTRGVSVPQVLPEPIAESVARLADQVGYTWEEWQRLAILVLPPEDSIVALALIAELHGRMGHFPGIVALSEGAPPVVVNLQQLRSASFARGRQHPA